ncbi:MAG TPA: heme-binding protein [Thermoanaerobaculia bacterium]|nr:heme-binding protein [Thermoanaerobaculia bacterium]
MRLRLGFLWLFGSLAAGLLVPAPTAAGLTGSLATPGDSAAPAARTAPVTAAARGSLPGGHHKRPPVPTSAPPICADGQPALGPAEVTNLALAAAGAVASPPPMTVAVVDRAGKVLGLYRQAGASTANDDLAIGLARTGAFFSNDQAPLSSRTVRFISGIHFPPGIANTPSAALYGIENTNRGCDLGITFLANKAVPPAGSFAGGLCQGAAHTAGCGTGPVTGKVDLFDSDPAAVDPGGVPLFRGTAVVGGIGVAGVPPAAAEFAAVAAAAATGLLPALPPGAAVFIDGIRLPFVKQTERPAGTSPGAPAGAFAAPGLQTGGCAPEGYLAGPAAGSQLSAAEVDQIVQQAIAGASRTRAQIRLPLGSRARMVIAVSDLDGTILALYRMPDATVFSIDVAVAKSRNVVYFSGGSVQAQQDLPGVPPGTAVTNRTIGFGAQPFYPPGIDGSDAGPFFGLLHTDAANPCTQGSQTANPQHQSGIVFFPGSLPLYHGSSLAGGLGVSGDGVEQDDYVTFLGAQGFLPPTGIWADNVFIGGVRLPFLKFPRNPEQ